LEGLTHVGGDILIKGNHALTSLNGLNNVNTVNGIAIINNSTLTSLSGLENILSNSHLSISNNPSLTSLAGLANLITVGGFYIVDNASLNTLIGLSSLDSVARLYIENNDSLPGLIGLDSIAARSVEEITIIFNDSLSSCAVQSICEYLASPNGTIEIHDNAPGCNSPEEVEAACETIGLAEIISDMGFNVYPNPSSDNVFFSFTLIESSEVKLEIHNNMGQIVSVMNKSFSQGGQQVVWDAENMPTGLYFYRLIKDKQPTSTGKLMVVR
jgi:hypothetical protein